MELLTLHPAFCEFSAVFVCSSDKLDSCCVASAVRLALNHKVLTSILSQQASVCKFYAFLCDMGLG